MRSETKNSENVQPLFLAFKGCRCCLVENVAMRTKLKNIGKVLIRILFGLMWLGGGYSWLGQSEPALYLEKALLSSIEQGSTFGFYEPFLKQVVLPNKALFAGLVSWGELLTGISLFTGTLVRFSAIVGVFLLTNYSLMNGKFFHPLNLLFITAQLSIFFLRSGRILGVDGLLAKRFGNSRWY